MYMCSCARVCVPKCICVCLRMCVRARVCSELCKRSRQQLYVIELEECNALRITDLAMSC